MTGRASCSAIANVPPRNYGRLLLDQRREKKKNRGKWLCGTREKGNVQEAAFDKPYLLEGNTVGKIVA